jgi:hypothetical protein
MANPQERARQQADLNARLRTALLATAPRNEKNIGSYVGPNTQTARFKLFNVGVITRLRVKVEAAVTIGTATATPSNKAPWNLIQRARLTDYDGSDRVNMSGFQLFMVNFVRSRTYWGFNNEAAAAVNANPVVPTAVGAGTISFFIDIPLAYDIDNPILQLQDLRGAILAQTTVGEMYLSIDWNPSLYTNNDVESVYSGGATTTVAGTTTNFITCTVYQHFLLPQALGSGPLPPLPGIDLMTVYELQGMIRSLDNIAVGSEKLVNIPNVRSVLGIYANYVQLQVSATAMAFANMGGATDNASRFRLIANGNNVLRENSNSSQVFQQRLWANSDALPGAYFMSFRDRPLETSIYGNVQWGLTPAVVGGSTANFEVGFESMYTKGQALPGMMQASG